MTGSFTPPRAKEIRRRARAQLKGNWIIAIIATLLAMMLGASVSGAPTVDFNLDLGDDDVDITTVEELEAWLGSLLTDDVPTIPSSIDVQFESPQEMEQWIEQTLLPMLDDLLLFARTMLLILWPFIVLGILIAIALAFVGACMSVGLCRFRLDLHDGAGARVETIFWGFGRVFFKALIVHIITSILITLGFLLFIIPGIIAIYRYSMVNYIMAENHNMDIMDILRESGRMMKGNKWRLFCLQFSFIGWSILSTLAFGIGHIWLNPYVGQAETAFYHEVSGRAAIRASAQALGEMMQGL